MSIDRFESKEQGLPPFYGLVDGIDPDIFAKIEIDPLSQELLDKGEVDQRYAVVGWLVDGKVQLRLRPGFPSSYNKDANADKRRLAEEKFGQGNIVIAKENQPGIVHDQLIDQVIEKEPSLRRVRNLFGGSLFKRIRQDGTIYLDWLNRSAINFTLFPRDPLALACHAYQRDIPVSALKAKNFDLDYDLNRSLPKAILERVAMTATKTLLGDRYTPLSCFIDDDCYSREEESHWNSIIHLGAKERNAEIQALLMRTLFIALHDLGSAKKKKMAGKTGQEVLLRRAFAAAQEYKIPLDFDYIPQEFKGYDPALVFAADGKYFSMVKLLLAHGARVNSQDFTGQTALHVAVKNKDLPLIKLLLDHQADPTIKNFSGATPLRLAELGEGENAAEIVNLLKSAAPAFTETSQQHQQCEEAIQQGDIATVKKGIATMTPENQARAFRAAVLSNNPAMVTLFLADNIHLSAPHKERGFLLAVNHGLIHSMKVLGSPEASLNRSDPGIQTFVSRSLVHQITTRVDNQQLAWAIILVDYLKADSATALKKAMNDNPDNALILLRQLLAEGKLSEETKSILIKQAIQKNNFEIFKLLADQSRDLNVQDAPGNSFLHFAVYFKNLEVVQFLLSKQVNIDPLDTRQQTPLYLASCQSSPNMRMIKLLIEAGANIEARTINNDSPLVSAFAKNDRGLIQLLLSKKADIDAANNLGRTALMHAAHMGRIVAVAMLLENGANFCLRDKSGKNALDIARDRMSTEVAALIEAHVLKVKNAFLHLFFPHSELRLFEAGPTGTIDEQIKKHLGHLPISGLETAFSKCDTPEQYSTAKVKITRGLFLSLVQELGTGEQQKWVEGKLPGVKEVAETKQTAEGRVGIGKI